MEVVTTIGHSVKRRATDIGAVITKFKRKRIPGGCPIEP